MGIFLPIWLHHYWLLLLPMQNLNNQESLLARERTKRLDLFGEKSYTLASYQAILSKYDKLQWDRFSDFKDQLPLAFRDEFKAKTSLQAELHTADCGVLSIGYRDCDEVLILVICISLTKRCISNH